MNVELTQNLWERYGFRDNPFDTRALSMSPGSLLLVAEAFVGRGMNSTESKLITNFFRSTGGGRVVVEGDFAIGCDLQWAGTLGNRDRLPQGAVAEVGLRAFARKLTNVEAGFLRDNRYHSSR